MIGTGHIAHQHLSCLASLPNVEIAAVCDLSPATAEATAEQFHVPRFFTDHRALLQDIDVDVVHITTSVNSHAEICRDALEAGAHVIIEKPLATELERVESLLALAEARERWVVEDYNYLFNPEFVAILDRLPVGHIGGEDDQNPIVHVALRLMLDMTTARGGVATLAQRREVVRDFLPHLASITHRLIGSVERVHVEWPVIGNGESIEFRALVSSASATADIVFSTRAQPDLFDVQVMTDEMLAQCQLFEPFVHFDRRRSGARPLTPLKNGLARARSSRSAALRGLWRKLAGAPGAYQGLWQLIRATYAALECGESPPVDHDMIRATNQLVHELLAAEVTV